MIAFNDFKTALLSWRVWSSLALQDIRLRYRGSILGPFWITLSTAVTVYAMGFLYGILFQIDTRTYLPYFASGVIAWTFLSMILNESTKIFLESKAYLENIQLPGILYVFKMVFRNVIILAHNLLVFFSLLLLFKIEIGWAGLNLIPGIVILSLNGIFYGAAVGFASARFPDVGAMVSSVLQIVFFLTPIMWMPSALMGRFEFFLAMNPFFHFVNLIRNPLLGIFPNGSEWLAVGAFTVLGAFLFALSVRMGRSKILFWL